MGAGTVFIVDWRSRSFFFFSAFLETGALDVGEALPPGEMGAGMTLPGDTPGEFGATLDLALATPSSDKPVIDVKSSDEENPGHRRSDCSPAALCALSAALSAAEPAAETSRGASPEEAAGLFGRRRRSAAVGQSTPCSFAASRSLVTMMSRLD